MNELLQTQNESLRSLQEDLKILLDSLSGGNLGGGSGNLDTNALNEVKTQLEALKIKVEALENNQGGNENLDNAEFNALKQKVATLETSLNDKITEARANEIITAEIAKAQLQGGSVDNEAIKNLITQELNKLDLGVDENKVNELIEAKSYLTQESLENTLTQKAFINNESLENTLTQKDYLPKAELETTLLDKGYIDEAELEATLTAKAYATKAELASASLGQGAVENVKNIVTEELAKKDYLSELDLEALQYIDETALNEKGFLTNDSLSDYALKTELPSVDNLVTNEALTQSLETKADKTALDNLALKSELPNLAEYALKSEIVDTSNLATKEELNTAKTELNQAITNANAGVSESKVNELIEAKQYTNEAKVNELIETNLNSKNYIDEATLTSKALVSADEVETMINDKGFLTSTNLNAELSNAIIEQGLIRSDDFSTKLTENIDLFDTLLTTKKVITEESLETKLSAKNYLTQESLNTSFETAMQEPLNKIKSENEAFTNVVLNNVLAQLAKATDKQSIKFNIATTAPTNENPLQMGLASGFLWIDTLTNSFYIANNDKWSKVELAKNEYIDTIKFTFQRQDSSTAYGGSFGFGRIVLIKSDDSIITAKSATTNSAIFEIDSKEYTLNATKNYTTYGQGYDLKHCFDGVGQYEFTKNSAQNTDYSLVLKVARDTLPLSIKGVAILPLGLQSYADYIPKFIRIEAYTQGSNIPKYSLEKQYTQDLEMNAEKGFRMFALDIVSGADISFLAETFQGDTRKV